MGFLVYSLGLHATFPGLVTDALPKVVGIPTLGLKANLGKYTYSGVEMGFLNIKVGDYVAELLSSTFYLGTFLNNYDVALGYTVSGVGISSLSIEDQGYMALTLKGGYMRRFGSFGMEGGVVIPIYVMSAADKVSAIPVPLLTFSLSYGW